MDEIIDGSLEGEFEGKVVFNCVGLFEFWAVGCIERIKDGLMDGEPEGKSVFECEGVFESSMIG